MCSGVSFAASGFFEPLPMAASRLVSTPCFVSHSTTDCARCCESFTLSKPLLSPSLSVLPSMDSLVISGLSFRMAASCVSTFFVLSFMTILALAFWNSMSPGMSICVALFI